MENRERNPTVELTFQVRVSIGSTSVAKEGRIVVEAFIGCKTGGVEGADVGVPNGKRNVYFVGVCSIVGDNAVADCAQDVIPKAQQTNTLNKNKRDFAMLVYLGKNNGKSEAIVEKKRD
jgi:hypothetical protein